MIKEIKEVHPEEIVLVKIGNFFHVYGKDSYILSYLLGYKIRRIEGNICTTGFPDKTAAKVKAMLEKNKIEKKYNYLVNNISKNGISEKIIEIKKIWKCN